MSSDNIKVAIKVRPLIKREKDAKLGAQWRIHQESIECTNPAYANYKFSFDHICDEQSSTSNLYSQVARPIVASSVNGFNGTIFAYGQTSSGKTHTMLGTSNEPGIMILAVREIFERMRANTHRSYLLRVSYIEIYNERIYDLFNNRNELKIQEHTNGDINVNCIEKMVESEQHIMELVQLGSKTRVVAETSMNVQSSRSHTIFSIIIESQENEGPELTNEENDGAVQISVLNLVDLAGSERADSTGATGSRLKEGGHINKSLLSLSLVINKLSEDPDQQKFINYRDSKLTRILQPSLGGNALTAIICTITPAVLEETNYTLGFANRAKKIKNKPIVNEILSDAAISKRLKKQIVMLEQQLATERTRIKQTEQTIYEKKLKVISCHTKISRRRTWTPNYCTPFDLSTCNEESTDEISSTKSQSKNELILGDEEFRSSVECTFGEQQLNEDEQLIFLVPPSSNSSGRHSDGLHNVSAVNGINKDVRIKDLEKELDELQNFQKIESLVNSSFLENNFKFLDTNLKEKDGRIVELENQLQAIQADKVDLEQRNSRLDIEWAEANKLRELAECNLTSLEYEYEQHKIKYKNRESELIEQINGIMNDVERESLQSRIKELSAKLKDLETVSWTQERSAEISLKAEKELSSQLKQKNEKLGDEIAKIKVTMDNVSRRNIELLAELEQLRCDKTNVNLKMNGLESEPIDTITNGIEEKAVDHSKHTQTDDLNANTVNICDNCSTLSVRFNVMCILAANYIEKYETSLEKSCNNNGELTLSSDTRLNTTTHSFDDDDNSGRLLTLHIVNKQLKKQIKLLKWNLTNERAKCKELSFKNDLLKNTCNAYKFNIRRTIMEFHILRRFYGQLESHIKEQDKNNQVLENELHDYKERYNEILLKLAEAETDNDNLSDMRSKYDDALRQIEAMNNIEENLKAKEHELVLYKEFEVKYNDGLERLESISDKLKSAEEELSSSRDLKDKYNNTLKQVADLKEALKLNHEELASATEHAANLTQSLCSAKEQTAIFNELKKDYEKAKKCIEDLSEELHVKLQMLASYQDLQTKYDEAQRRIDSITELNKSLQEKEQMLAVYNNLEAKYDVALKKLANGNEELLNFPDLNSKHNNILKCIGDLNEKLKQAMDDVAKLRITELKFNEVSDQLTECNEKLSTAEQQLAMNEGWKSKYYTALEQVEKLKESNEELAKKEELIEIKETLRLKEQELLEFANLQMSYSSALKHIADLNETIKQLQLKQSDSINKINSFLSEKNKFESECHQLISERNACIQNHEQQVKKTSKLIRKILNGGELSSSHLCELGENDLAAEIGKITVLVHDMKSLKHEYDKTQQKLKHLHDEKLKFKQLYENLVKDFETYKKEHTNQKLQRDNAKKKFSSPNNQSIDEDDGFIIDKTSTKGKSHDSSRDSIDIRNAVHHERKIRRQSFHDDTRRVSGFDSTHCDANVQTEPCTDACRCADLDNKITQLRRDLVIKDAKINTMKITAGIDMTKRENDELKAKLSSLQDQFKKEQIYIQQLNAEYEKLNIEKMKIQSEKCSNVTASTQTEDSMSKNMIAMDRDFGAEKDFFLMSQKYQSAKKHFADLRKDYDNVVKKFEDYMKKYDVLKKLCQMRGNDVEKLKAVNEELVSKIKKLEVC